MNENIIHGMKIQSVSKISILIIISVVLVVDTTLVKKSDKILDICDIQQYYAYLPATIIYNDLSLSFREKNPEKLKKYVWGLPSSTGNSVIMTSMGLSILYAPTFLISHLFAKIFHYETDGYSLPYYVGLKFNLVIYLFIGLLFLRKVLLRFFNDRITALTIFILFFGTNLFYYATYESPFAHAYEFSLIAIFIYYIIKWYEKPNIKYTILIGSLSGLIALIRPTDVIVLLLFIFWDVTDFHSLQERFRLFLKKWQLILGMSFFFILIWIPQMIYWKSFTGQYFYYSYDSTSHFDFLSPHIIKGLFSYQKGWLLYTPIMVFSLTGIFLLQKKYKDMFLPILLYTIFNVYVVLSWFCWWYGGSFGLRAFIDSYSILSLPLAVFIAKILNYKPRIRFGLLSILCFLILFNLFQTIQYRNGAIHYANMTKKAYWETFGKIRPTSDFYKYLKDPLTEK